jgi:hypothetical protein
LGSEALSVKFPNLFVIAENQLMSVPRACADPNAVRFRRSLCPRLRAEWVELVAFLNGVQLGTDRDRIVWDLEPSGVFSVKSMYAKLSQGASVAHFKDIWEAKLPLKIKIFTWQIALNRLPTRALIVDRHGPGSGMCLVWV